MPVRVDPWFFVVVAAIGWAAHPGPLSLLSWVAIALAAVLVHELGHAAVLVRSGLDCEVQLYALGGLTVARGNRRLSPGRALVFDLAGPAVGLVVGAVIAGLQHSVGAVATHPVLRLAAHDLVFANFGWAIFNLLPVLPLDGGQAVSALLDQVWRGKGERGALVVSVVVGAAVAMVAVAVNDWLGVALMVLFGADNAVALSRWRPPPGPADHERWLAEGYRALEQGARLAAVNKAQQVMAGSELAAVRAAAATLLQWALLVDGRMEEAAEVMAAWPVSPGDVVLSPEVLRATGGPDAAVELLEKGFRLRPGDAAGTRLAAALVETGRLEDALALSSDEPSVGTGTRVLVAAALFGLGRFDEAARLGERAFADDRHPALAYNVACAWARAGRAGDALAWVERAVAAGHNDVAQLDHDPDLASVRKTPGFEEIRRRASRPSTP